MHWRSQLLRIIAAGAILACGILVLSLVIGETQNAGNKDFTSYWAAGQLLARHANPYDRASVLSIEKSAGFALSKPLIMRNPPFALLLALPLGFIPAKVGAVTWSLLLVAAIMLSVRLIWAIHGRPPGGLHILGYIFAPVLACLTLGQTSAFALLGVVLFLHLHGSRSFAAGAALALAALKPHLFLPCAVLLTLWVIKRREYAVPAGALTAIVCALAPVLLMDPALVSHYVPVLKEANTESALIPTFSSAVYAAARPLGAWVQFLPVALGCLWAVLHFLRHHRNWDWNRHGLLVLLVSVWVAPYSWFTDEIVVLPAILGGVFLATNRSLISFLIVDGVALAAALFGVPVGSGFFVWTSTAWLGWYLLALPGGDC